MPVRDADGGLVLSLAGYYGEPATGAGDIYAGGIRGGCQNGRKRGCGGEMTAVGLVSTSPPP
jgi:hypothetical protein